MKALGNDKSNDEFVAAVRGLQLTMKFLGIWQHPDSQGGCNLAWYVHSVCAVFIVFGPAAGFIVNISNAAKTIGNLCVLPIAIAVFLKWVAFAVHSKTVGKLIRFMEEDWLNLVKDIPINRSVPNSKRIMEEYYKPPRIFFLTFITILTFGMLVFVGESLISLDLHYNGTDSDPDNLFLVPYSWYPLDYSRGYTVQILLGAQTIAAPTIILASASIDNFFSTVCFHLCAQFEILGSSIESFKYDLSRTEYCEIEVRLIVRRHQELLSVNFRAAERIQESYSFTIAAQYVSVMLSICFVGYAIIAEMEKINTSATFVIKSGALFGAFLQLIFTYCFVGDRLTDQSASIAVAVYNSDWYNSPRSIRLVFVTMIARAGRPVRITGAKLILVSLESFADLLKASGSYLSVLRAVGVTDG